MSAVWEGPCNCILCEKEHEMTSLANTRDEEQARQADPPQGTGGGTALNPPLALCLQPPFPLTRPRSSWQGRAPLPGIGIPRDPLAGNQEPFPLPSPGLAQVQSQNKALDAAACSTGSHQQNRSDQLADRSLQRDWREPGRGSGGGNPGLFLGNQTKRCHLIISRAGRSYF